MAELGPRDVVARAIARRAAATGADVTSRPEPPRRRRWCRRRFPTVAALCAEHGLDLARDPIPVTPGRPLRHRRRAGRHGGAHHASRASSPSASARRRARTGPTGSPPTACSRPPCWPPARRARCADDPTTGPRAPRRPRSPPARGAAAAARCAPRLQEAMWRGVGVERDADGLEDASARAGRAPRRHRPRDRQPPARRAARAPRRPTCAPRAAAPTSGATTRPRPSPGPAHRLGRRLSPTPSPPIARRSRVLAKEAA